ncbi:MAG TPA: VWA domain-containing protein [Thermoanaerobaculia bacterium]|nr:VWA domain-containing protein [Thermoanaerobaculia bacterium]
MRPLALVVVMFAAAAAQAQFGEQIEVVRILVDVRVTDSRGNAIDDLTPADFDVQIGGQATSVVSSEFVRDEAVESSSRPADERTPLENAPGRRIIVFVQTDFARESARIRGQLDFLRYAEKMVETFAPEDRIAVFQFDSHLKFRLDFTRDKAAVREALGRTFRIEIPPPPPAVEPPSLGEHLDPAAMRRAANSEAGLRIVGDALRHIPGPKSLLLLGWGLGRFSRGNVWMTSEYTLARQALDASRTSIFALDTTRAAYHSLEHGLVRAAEETGGFYSKTHEFPQLAVDRLKRTLAGHYELELRRPADLEPGTHALRVRVQRRGAIVLAPTTYMDRH